MLRVLFWGPIEPTCSEKLQDFNFRIFIFFNIVIGRCKQIDVIIGLDLSKNTNESQFDQQRQFFQELIEGLYLYNDTDTSYRVGVFAYDDTIIKPKNKLWPVGNMTEFEAKEALKPFNYSIDQNNPYLDHALRFVLASLDDDRSNNKDRECSEKILVLVVTDIVEKWSNGKRDLARLKTMGVKTLFVVVGKAADSELLKGEEILIVSSFNNSMDIQTNASHFLRNILEEGIYSALHTILVLYIQQNLKV